MTLNQRRAADPVYPDVERANVILYRQTVGLLDKLDRARDRLDQVERLDLTAAYVRPATIAAARHRFTYYAAAAERAGLIRPMKGPTLADLTRSPADNHERQPRLPIDPDAGFPTMSAMEFAILRESIGTQQEVATELQTARKSIGRWERGDRPVPGIAAAAIKLLADVAKARRERTHAAVAEIMADASR